MTLLLADVGIAVTFVLVIVLAVIAVLVGAFGLVIKVLGSVVRTIFARHRNAIQFSEEGYADVVGKRVCGNPACGEENAAEAVYCRRCGRRLSGRGPVGGR